MESARGFNFLDYSKCNGDLNKVKNSHNLLWIGLGRVAQGRVERVPFLRLALGVVFCRVNPLGYLFISG